MCFGGENNYWKWETRYSDPISKNKEPIHLKIVYGFQE